MKKMTILAILLFTGMSYSYSQYKVSNGVNYSQSLQIDSSDYYFIGNYISKANKSKYNFTNRESYEGYTPQNLVFSNILIQHIPTKKIVKMFPAGLFAIYPILNTVSMNKYDYGYGYIQRGLYSGMSDKHLIYLAKSDEFNSDGMIDEDDPVGLYISTKKGENFKQLTATNMHVTSWTLSKDSKTIIIVVQEDRNNDKKFNDEDEAIYQIDLTQDIPKMKLSLVSF